jgi:deoxyadenosine/deoxycytidine kinase
MLPWRYIVVEGVIGVGKTSLTKLLASRMDGMVNLEVVEENPFLKQFYQDRAQHAFQTQIFFLLSSRSFSSRTCSRPR